MEIKYLITGTGRSGTVHMAKFMTSIGLTCGHESVFTNEGIQGFKERIEKIKPIETSEVSCKEKEVYDKSWFDKNKQIAESSYMAAPFVDQCEWDIIHVVRNPLKVISSTLIDAKFFTDIKQKPYYDFVCNHVEIKDIKNHTERIAAYYVLWNKMIKSKIEKNKYILIRIEDKKDKLFEFLNICPPKKYFQEKANMWNLRTFDLTLDHIPNGTIKNNFMEIMNEYGYL